MPRPSLTANKKVNIGAWVKPGVKIAFGDLSRSTGKSRSDLVETAINKLFYEHIKRK